MTFKGERSAQSKLTLWLEPKMTLLNVSTRQIRAANKISLQLLTFEEARGKRPNNRGSTIVRKSRLGKRMKAF